MCTLLIFLFIFFLEFSVGEISLCSSENTGSSGDATTYQYQSNGACEQTCNGYAYAILLDEKCWCSNVTPGSTESLDSCSDKCPGYPSDQCGNLNENYFAYIQIGNPTASLKASSTSSSSSQTESTTTSEDSTSSSSSSTSSSSATTTSSSSPLASPSASPSSPTTTAATTKSKHSSTITSSSSQSSTTNDQPMTSIIIKTIAGSAATTIITTQVSQPTGSTSKSSNSGNSFFQSPGKVAGVFVVVGLIVLALVLLLIWFFYFRRNRDIAKKDESDLSSTENDLEKMYNTQVMVDQRLDPNSMFLNLNNSKKSLGDEFDYSRKVLRVVNE